MGGGGPDFGEKTMKYPSSALTREKFTKRVKVKSCAAGQIRRGRCRGRGGWQPDKEWPGEADSISTDWLQMPDEINLRESTHCALPPLSLV